MVLQGRCDLVFEVVKKRRLDKLDSSNETNQQMMQHLKTYAAGHEEREAE